MNMVVESIYERGILKRKKKVEAPNNDDVLVAFKDKTNKEKSLKSAGLWKDIDTGIIDVY